MISLKKMVGGLVAVTLLLAGCGTHWTRDYHRCDKPERAEGETIRQALIHREMLESEIDQCNARNGYAPNDEG